jgi:UDP-glucose 4-epimerase
VVVVDNLSTGRRENLQHIDPTKLEFIHASVSRAVPQLQGVTFDEIYHLAAAVGVRLVIERPIHTIENNVLETSSLLEFAARTRTPFMLASTSEVYGKGSRTPFSEDDDVVYGPTIYNRWSYACSKAIDEYLALAYHRQHGLPAQIIRFFNTVGPRQVGEYGMVLPRFVAAALAGQPLEVHGDGRQSRCFCDVRDVIKFLPQMMRNASCYGRVFNLGSDQPIQIRALAELVIRTLQSSSTIVHVPYEEAFGTGFDDLRDRRPDLTRVKQSAGFDPVIGLERTIRDIADDMLNITTKGSASKGASGDASMVETRA